MIGGTISSALRCVIVASVALLWTTPVAANSVLFDFNDNSVGQLADQAGGQGGTGDWAGATAPRVVAGDLNSPLIALPQSGTPQSVQSTSGSSGGASVAYRTLATPLAGEVWFSFLGQLTDGDDRAALSLNSTTPSVDADDADFIFVAAGATGDFRVRVGAGSTSIASGLSTNGSATNLVVGRIGINESGMNDGLQVWLNPNLQQLAAGNVTPGFSSAASHWVTGSAVSVVGVSSYGGNGGGKVDAVRLSDTASAFADVTGASATDFAVDFGTTAQALQGPVQGVVFTRAEVTTAPSIAKSLYQPNVDVTLSATQLQGRNRNNLSGVTPLDALLDDLVFNSQGASMTLTLDGLDSGWHQFTGYFNDSFFDVNSQDDGLSGNTVNILDSNLNLLDSVVVSDVRNGNGTTFADVGIADFLFFADGVNPVSFTLLGTSTDTRFAFNGFQVTAASVVPEPSTGLLIVCGGAVVWILRRRQTQRA